jgi:tetratricopeptide (TPR) repeat protein
LAWSRAQLPPEVQTLFARLSMFANGWTVESAVAVCDVESAGRSAILEGLEQLLDHSLIQRQVVGDETRFSMLAMVRAYAHEQIESAEREPLHQRMADYFVAMAEVRRDDFRVGGNQAEEAARLAAEGDNMRAVLAWAATGGAEAIGLRLVAALARFWYLRGQVHEGRQWAETFLHQPPPDVAPDMLADAFAGAGLLAYRQSDHLQAEGWYQQALTLYDQSNSTAGKADILRKLGLLADGRGDMQSAIPYFESSLNLYRQVGDDVGAAQMMHNLGNMANQQNDFERAMDYYHQTLAVYQRVGDESGISLVLLGAGAMSRDLGNPIQAQAELEQSYAIATRLGETWVAAVAQLNLGDLAADRGDFGEAERLLREAFVTFESIGDQQLMCNVQVRLGSTLWLAGDTPGAIRHYRQSLMLANGIGYDGGITEAVEGLAGCISDRSPTVSARLFGFTTARRDVLGMPVAVADHPRLERALHLAQRALAPVAWERAYAEGATLTDAQAVRLALANS